VDDFYAARDSILPPLPWPSIAPPFTTQERYETAFYESFASDWRNFEAWELDGGKWTATRAHGIFKDILDEVTPPPMEPAINEGLLAFVAKRKQEGGVATDY